MTRLALHFLGTPRIELDGQKVHIGRTKAVALLAYLAVTGAPRSREALATLLWPESTTSRGRAGLRRVLVTLRQALGEEWLDVQPETVGLLPNENLWLDVATFHERLSECETHDHRPEEACPDCASLLNEAVELYQDDFLAGFNLPDSLAFDEWQFFQAEGLRDELVSALERLVRWHGDQGEHESAIAHARRWLELDPLHEPAHRELMVLYARANRRTAALRQYQLCEENLSEELDLYPSEETTALYVRIRSGEDLDRKPVTPPLIPHNLPPQPTPFVGREGELAHIVRRLDNPDCRLLTLIGPGGIGKTRLAVQAAQRIVEASPERSKYAHGVFFVPLVAVSAVDALVPSVASALDFSFYSGADPKRQLLDYLRKKEMLLVLDNFEHFLSPQDGRTTTGADLVTEILTAAPGVEVLVTSREALSVQQEWFHPVEGMAYPADDAEALVSLESSDAVALFMQCARRARPGFSLADEARWVLRICCLVEGMPLAIELAAAWLRTLPAVKIAKELERGLDILTTSMRDLPARHRSARAVFDHSWNLLTAQEREAMQTLSVFRGGFRGRAAQAVAGAPLALLADLVEKSMLAITPSGRYHMHELLRQYAAEKLQKSPQASEAAHDRHCEYYAVFLKERGEELKGGRQQAALGELRADIENARAAWGWAVEQRRLAQLDQALDGLCRFYEWRGRFQDGESACRSAVETPLSRAASAREIRTLAKTLTWQAAFSRALGQTERASQLLQESLGLLKGPGLYGQDTRAEEAFAHLEMGPVAYILGSRAEAKRWYECSLASYRSLGDESGMASSLERLGDTAWGSSDFCEAKRCYEQSLAIRRSQGDRRGMADALLGLSGVTASSGQFDELAESERLAREAVAIHNETGSLAGVARALVQLGGRFAVLGKFADACPVFEEAAGIYDDLGLRLDYAVAQDLLGWMKTNLRSYDEARALCETALTAFREVEDHHGVGMSYLGLGEIASAHADFVEARQLLEESAAIFREVGQREHEALALIASARVSIGLCQPDRAHEDLAGALQIATHVRAFAPAIFGVAISALLLLHQDEVERAVELCALASRYPYFGNSRFWEDVAGKHIAAAAAALPSEVVAAAHERGRARDLWGTAEELLDELNA